MNQEPITFKTNGREFKIFVDNNGKFFCDVGEHIRLMDPLFETLTRKITKHTKQSLAIVFWRWHDDKFDKNRYGLRRGTITGVHSGNGHLMVKWDDSEKGSDQAPRYAEFLRLTDKEQDEYRQMCEAYASLRASLEKFRKQHAIDLRAEVDQEIDKEEK